MEEFEYSFKGLINIIRKRKLHKKPSYQILGICVLLVNIIIFYISYNTTIHIDYFNILKTFATTFSPAFITFCGFTMTAYSLVVGFLNYGVFKPTIEKWYRKKIEINQGKSEKKLPLFSLYQNGIALFAFSILILLLTVILFLIIKFLVDLNIEIENDYIDIFNAFILLVVTLLTTFSILLIFYNIVNIFTFSQALNQLVYIEELEKIEKEKKQ